MEIPTPSARHRHRSRTRHWIIAISRGIHDNLNWAHIFNAEASPIPPVDSWQEIKAVWAKSDEEFVTGLYEVLLGRRPEPSALATMCLALAQGATRFALVRTIALSDEAAFSPVDISWLAQLNDIESNAVWEKMQSLWAEPDHVFVAGLYPLLLVRPPERIGVAAHCRAMKAGTSRACVVRAVAFSDEAQIRGVSLSWLPRLETLPPNRLRSSLLSLHWLKAAFRRWRKGEKNTSTANPLDLEASLQPVKADRGRGTFVRIVIASTYFPFVDGGGTRIVDDLHRELTARI